MVYLIVSAIVLLERSGIEDAIAYVSDACEKYLRNEFSIEYYREFNPESLYRCKYVGYDNTGYGVSNVVRNSDRELIDTNYNYNVLRELWSILLEIYELRRRPA